MDAIYFDFAKAFATVPRERLLLKCYPHADPKKYADMDTLISDRKITAGSGEWSQVTSGIPQGSALGPLLFLIFINCMPDDIVSSININAHDTIAFKDVQTEDDMLIVQKDVDPRFDWSLKWQLKFNAKNVHT